MRMIGIGLMAFIVALGVFMLSAQNIPQRSFQQLRELALGSRLIFETKSQNAAELGSQNAVFFRATRESPIILSGLPSYQSATFLLPIDARAISGYLQIDLTSQVLDGVAGVLRVSINNTKRGEMLLYPGEVGRSMLVPLKPNELAKERLVASFSLLGSYDSESCHMKNGIQAIIEIEATSGLYLNLDRKITTARDQLFANGRRMSVLWDDAFSDDIKSELLLKAASFLKRGEALTFTSDMSSAPMKLATLKNLDHMLPSFGGPSQNWPYYVAREGANFGLRRFYNNTNWRIKYHVDQFQDGTLPSQFSLQLTLVGAGNHLGWTVSVTLNGKLIHADILRADSQTYQHVIDLPPDDQSANNLIEVTLDSADTHDGICNEGPILLAQMAPSSALIGGTQIYSPMQAELRAVIASNPTVLLSGLNGLLDSEATLYASLLAAILPNKVAVTVNHSGINTRFIKRADSIQALERTRTEMRSWLISMGETDDINIAEQNPSSPRHSGTNAFQNAILVSLPKAGA